MNMNTFYFILFIKFVIPIADVSENANSLKLKKISIEKKNLRIYKYLMTIPSIPMISTISDEDDVIPDPLIPLVPNVYT